MQLAMQLFKKKHETFRATFGGVKFHRFCIKSDQIRDIFRFRLMTFSAKWIKKNVSLCLSLVSHTN